MKTILVLALNLVGCGAQLEDVNAKAKADGTENDGSAIKFQGYLMSAFDISVDGKQYDDSEDFYTQKVDELEEQKAEAGYGDYTVKFEASIGLDDIKQGMKVYVVPSESRGYAAETVIDYDGTFKVDFPAEAQDGSVKVRANKRVNVKLSKGKETVYWCYNFSAKEIGTKVDKNGKPIILDKFFTKLTKYKCQESTSGITIPEKASPGEAIEVSNVCKDGPGIPVSEAIEHSDVEYYKECVTKATK